MPHLTIQYTPNINTDFNVLCHTLVDTMLAVRDQEGKQVFPEGGTRVMAFPASHYAVGDGKRSDYAYIYFNLRIIEGRSEAVLKEVGDRTMDAIKQHIEPVFSREAIGISFLMELQPVEKPKAIVIAYEGRHNNLRTIYGR
jgi:5-carboxymethyl-2-hydroxymuconate isomerase